MPSLGEAVCTWKRKSHHSKLLYNNAGFGPGPGRQLPHADGPGPNHRGVKRRERSRHLFSSFILFSGAPGSVHTPCYPSRQPPLKLVTPDTSTEHRATNEVLPKMLQLLSSTSGAARLPGGAPQGDEKNGPTGEGVPVQ